MTRTVYRRRFATPIAVALGAAVPLCWTAAIDDLSSWLLALLAWHVWLTGCLVLFLVRVRVVVTDEFLKVVNLFWSRRLHDTEIDWVEVSGGTAAVNLRNGTRVKVQAFDEPGDGRAATVEALAGAVNSRIRLASRQPVIIRSHWRLGWLPTLWLAATAVPLALTVQALITGW